MLGRLSPRHLLGVAVACALVGVAGLLWHVEWSGPSEPIGGASAPGDGAPTVTRETPPARALPSAGQPASSAMSAEAADIEAQLSERRLLIPVVGVSQQQLRDTFNEKRGDKLHDAIDIPAPRGTPVVATDDGRVVKLFHSVPGGLTIYQADRANAVMYYYAHLNAYAEGLREGDLVMRGDVIGYVGSSGNASANAPHLHFAILRLPPGKEWWKGTPINPIPFFARSGP